MKRKQFGLDTETPMGELKVIATNEEAIEADTFEDIYLMLRDAMTLWIETAIDKNREIPLPEVMQQEKFSGKFIVRLPKSLHHKLASLAKNEGVSLNQLVNYLLSIEINGTKKKELKTTKSK